MPPQARADRARDRADLRRRTRSATACSRPPIASSSELGDWERRDPGRLRVHLDDRDGMKPGAKYYEWELQGVPLRMELGPRDLDENQAVLGAPRHAREDGRSRSTRSARTSASCSRASSRTCSSRRATRREANSIRRRISYDDFRALMEGPGAFVYAGWCGGPECEAQIKEETKATIRVLPDEEFRSAEAPTTCLKCGRACDRRGGMGQGVLTTGFARARRRRCYCEGVSARARSPATSGTPVYVYSAATIRDRYQRLDADARGRAAPNSLHAQGELEPRRAAAAARARRGRRRRVRRRAVSRAARRVRAGRHHFRRRRQDGSASSREALDAGVLLINAESEAEVRLIDRLARERGDHRRRVSLRVNPEVTLESPHEYIKTGGKRPQVRHSARRRRARRASVRPTLPNVELVGLDMHLGSQLSRIDPVSRGHGAPRVDLLRELAKRGIDDARATSTSAAGWAFATTPRSRPTSSASPRLVLPTVAGDRAQAHHGAWPLRRRQRGRRSSREVLYRKHSGGKDYVVADAGMTELLRPSHYGAFHRIVAVRRARRTSDGRRGGPVCESGDFLALDREMDDVQPGDLLVVCDVGAYGYAMASNYNSRPRPAEVLVDGDRFAVITAREAYDDLVRLEIAAPEWTTRRDALMRVGLIADTHDRMPAIAELVKRDAGRGVEHGAARRATTARRSRSSRSRMRTSRSPACSARTTAITRGSCRAAQARSAPSCSSRRTASRSAAGACCSCTTSATCTTRSICGARDRDPRADAPAGNEDARRDADRQSRRGVRMALRHALGRDARPGQPAGGVPDAVGPPNGSI